MGCSLSCGGSCGTHSCSSTVLLNRAPCDRRRKDQLPSSKKRSCHCKRLSSANSPAAMEYITFHDHPTSRMPMVGLGTWTAKDDEMEAALESALEMGYRHIDTATVYYNEHVIGKVLERWLSSGRIKREDLFITTKLPVYGNRSSDVEKWIKRSLEKLQCEYLDLYLIHVPFCFKQADKIELDDESNVRLDTVDHIELWAAMEEQVTAGRTKAIGLSNFNQHQIERILQACTIKPANLQIENHIFLQQQFLVAFCQANNITVTSYSPLGNPSLQTFFTKIGISREIPNVMGSPEVIKIAERIGKLPAQVVLRFNIQRGIAVIPKSVNPERQKQNLELFDFELTPEDMESLRSLDRGEEGRLVRFEFFKGVHKHPEFPFEEPGSEQNVGNSTTEKAESEIEIK